MPVNIRIQKPQTFLDEYLKEYLSFVIPRKGEVIEINNCFYEVKNITHLLDKNEVIIQVI